MNVKVGDEFWRVSYFGPYRRIEHYRVVKVNRKTVVLQDLTTKNALGEYATLKWPIEVLKKMQRSKEEAIKATIERIKRAKTKYLEEIKLLDKELRELEALLKEGRS